MLEIPIIIFFHFLGVGTVDNEVVPKHLVTQYNGSPMEKCGVHELVIHGSDLVSHGEHLVIHGTVNRAEWNIK